MIDKNLLDLIIITIGSIIGSIKLGIETRKNKPFSITIIDIFTGIFTGILLGYHFGSEYNIYISGLISLIGGAVGALAITTIIQIFPNLFSKWLDKLIGK